MRPWNRNYVGTHFGGSLFAMTDPFWMLLVLHALGDDYIVWDRSAEIRFDKPGRGTVWAEFKLDPAAIDAIRDDAAGGDKQLRWFDCAVFDGQAHAAGAPAAVAHSAEVPNTGECDADQQVVARERKQLYIRRKRNR